MTNQSVKPEEDSSDQPSLFMRGLNALLGAAGHQPIEDINFSDTVKAMVKTVAGSFAMASGTTNLDVKFNKEAQMLERQGSNAAELAEAQGEADATRLMAQIQVENKRLDDEARKSAANH